MRAGQSMVYAKICKVLTYVLKFSTPIRLEILDFQVKLSLYSLMKIHEGFKDIALEFKRIQPRIAGEVIKKRSHGNSVQDVIRLANDPIDRSEPTQEVCSFDFLSLHKAVCVIRKTCMHKKMSSYCRPKWEDHGLRGYDGEF